MKKIILTLLIAIVAMQSFANNKKERYYYLIKTFHCKTNEQIIMVDDYLKNIFVPFLHNHEIKKVGVFKPIDNDTVTDKRIIVLIPFDGIDDVADLENEIDKQNPFAKTENNNYINAPFNEPPFIRIETTLLYAFKNAPELQLPKLTASVNDKIYELRSYESATESLNRKKVHMFNEGGEIDIFTRLNFNAIFYAEVIAGSHQPNLMYLTSFNNMKEHDEHWKAFGNDAAWKKLSAMPEYANTVSKHDITLMHATDYSDL